MWTLIKKARPTQAFLIAEALTGGPGSSTSLQIIGKLHPLGYEIAKG
jgi:hypothetical protein